jgi:serine/threonine protein kinase
MLASLNHPHIATIHGLEPFDNSRALVMELVEGVTLAQRIARGSLPLADALGVARQPDNKRPAISAPVVARTA